ncbi:SDR family oxidoreductase [Sneathiella glossodoripedis]|uniref:SDR family oxidoreductase n=1 Tax=Sneathiella glossodoripedis TaxID=418853 RepID=UPI00046F54DC|nr:SDR family oxidoreductase [Sneathiella glossodoripedis]
MANGLLCFGFGFTAKEIAKKLPDWKIWGTSRSIERQRTDFDHVEPVLFNGIEFPSRILEISHQVTHILLSVPPGEDGDPVCELLRPHLQKFKQLKWVGYLSTTGVYGDLNGGVATEDTPRNPSGVRGQRRVDAEDAWTSLAQDHNLPLHIFRLPGIYGPGRNQLVSLQKGKAHRIVKKGHVFSRIHVADLANILIASMDQPNPGRVYNVADDLPAPPQDVVTYAAQLLNVTPPPLQEFEAAALSPLARSFYSDNKTVSNERIKTELGISLSFPTYKDGLKALSEEL